MNTLTKVVIIVLVVVAAVLGFKIYRKNVPSVPVNQNSQSSQNSGSNAASSTPVSTIPNSAGSAKIDPKILLNTPKGDATEQERREFGELVIKSAVSTKQLDITSCVVNPVVSSVIYKSVLTLINNDSGPHTVTFDAEKFFTVPAKSTKDITVDFGKGPGIYGYGCDRSGKAVGLMVVTEK